MKAFAAAGLCVTLATSVSSLVGNRELPAWGERLGWTLVHSVWQLTVAAILALVADVCLRRRSANTRYVVAVVAMSFVVALPCITWMLMIRSEPPTVATESPMANLAKVTGETDVIADPNSNVIVTTVPEQDIVDGVNSAGLPARVTIPDENIPEKAIPVAITVLPQNPPEQTLVVSGFTPGLEQVRQAIVPWLGYIISAWFVGVALLAIRPAWGLWTQSRLRRIGISTVSDELRQQMQRVAQRMGVLQVVGIAESTLVRVPMVVGYLRPIILLPVSLLSGLTPLQLESLLAHELAHIRRHDWIVNALQVVIETLFFYHPAVWWLSNRIRQERELCCDDIAVAIIGDRATYGRMLLVLEELLHHSPSPALAATGGNLVQRVRRLLPMPQPPQRTASGWLAGFIVLTLIVLTGGLSILSAQPSSSEDLPIAKETDVGAEESKVANAPETHQTVNDESSSPMTAVLALSTFDEDEQLRDPLIDLSRMTVAEAWFHARDHSTRLNQDRWLRNRGFGDLSRSDEAGWIAFRGARILALKIDDLDEAAKLPLAELKSRIAKDGRVVLPEAEVKSGCMAIQTGEGHVAVMKFLRPFPWSQKLDVRRLTSDKDVPLERANDGVDSAAWGPVVDGFQAGIAYRTRELRSNSRSIIGEMVPVKLFVRNTSREAKTYAWQLDDNPSGVATNDLNRSRPRLPLIRVWQPILVDSAEKQAAISLPGTHRKFVLQTAKLQPGEAVLVGAAAMTLWPAIDVDFGIAADRLVATEVSPGEYRLSSDVDTGLISSPKLRTGELSLRVEAADPQRLGALQELDELTDQRGGFYGGDDPWSDGKPGTRRALRHDAVEYLTIPCLVYDEETKQPVAGATVEFEIKVERPSISDSLCEYRVVTNVDGRFDVRIPKKLLSGYSKEYETVFHIFVRHPQYTTVLERPSLKSLQGLGLVANNGAVLKQGDPPDFPDPGDEEIAEESKTFQRIAVQRARTLTGRYLGPDRKPLPNTRITGSSGTEKNFVGQHVHYLQGLPHTDSEGRFRVNVPEKRTANLEFEPRGLPHTNVEIAADQTKLGDVFAAPGTRVRGLVLDANGKPVAYVGVTTPVIPKGEGPVTNQLHRTDETGWFETYDLAPGQYQVEISDVESPDDRRRNEARIIGPPPDLYSPVQFTVVAGKPVADLTIRPAKSTNVTATLITTIPAVAEGESGHTLDALLMRHLLHEAIRKRAEEEPPAEGDDKQKQTPAVEADGATGELTIKGDPKNELAFEVELGIWLSQIPHVRASGTLADQSWSGSTRTNLFGEPEEQDKQTELPLRHSFKVPRDLTDVTLESELFIQHLQIGSGPKLFGNSIRVPKLDADQLELKIYRYLPTTLRIVLVDAFDKPVEMKGDQLPGRIAVSAKYLREAEVRRAGVNFESSEALMFRHVWDNSVLHFVLPGEEIEVSVTFNDTPAIRRFTLKDGETRTVQVKLGQKLEWTESTKPTPKLDLKP